MLIRLTSIMAGLIVVFGAMGTLPTYAQDELCPVDFTDARTAMDAAETATSSAARLDAIRTAQFAIAALESFCAGAAEAEATAEGPMTASEVTPGKWHVEWGDSLTVCQNGTVSTADDRDFILQVDTAQNRITIQDAYAWGDGMEFIRAEDGSYFNRRPGLQGAVFEYLMTIEAPDRITGVGTAISRDGTCELPLPFTLTLVDPTVTCLVLSATSVNIRATPAGSPVGTLQALERADVTGKALGRDNFVWWQLGTRGWVRNDVVTEAGQCTAVPGVDL